ncbi:putative RNA-binding Zn ribbon-like protein [Mycetocola sp. CAN_C7]|uniref:CGNR zinc finger domain-containing protein n=1 Tax=Mycetocola sp. CAN_C7 TaxID=2787724 RepID=UPI0018CA3A6B
MASDLLDFRLDGGATWLNLLATRGRPFAAHPIERLTDAARLAEWLEAVDLNPAAAPTDADLAATRALREALRVLALAVTSDDAGGDATTLERFLTPPPAPTVIDGELRMPQPATTTDALSRIAWEGALHLAGPERRNLHECAAEGCRYVFADPSGRRRYCPSAACATRERVRAHRARQKASVTAAD